ncbi:hypothetical protein MRX96_047845 [Rhipicephalus microplus]
MPVLVVVRAHQPAEVPERSLFDRFFGRVEPSYDGGFTCCVPGCYNNSTRDKGLGFYVFPKEQKLRETWIQHINRAGRGGSCFGTVKARALKLFSEAFCTSVGLPSSSCSRREGSMMTFGFELGVEYDEVCLLTLLLYFGKLSPRFIRSSFLPTLLIALGFCRLEL